MTLLCAYKGIGAMGLTIGMLAACSATSDGGSKATSSGTGGTAGAGGSDGGHAGGSGGDAPSETPEAAWVLTFTGSPPGCSVPQHGSQLGEIDDNVARIVVADGQYATDVECSVKELATAFSVEGATEHSGITLSIDVPAIEPTATKDAPAFGTAGFESQYTKEQYVSPAETPCEFYFAADTDQTVEAGSVWLAFNCPEVNSARAAVCAITDGIALFRKCVK